MLMNHRLTISLTAAAAVALGAPVAGAAEQGFALDRFSTAEAGSAWLQADSLSFGNSQLRSAAPNSLAGSLVLRLGGSFARDPLVIATEGSELVTHVVARQATATLGATFVPFAGFRVGLLVPHQVHAAGDRGTDASFAYPAPSRSRARGDVRVGAHYMLLNADSLRIAVGGQVFLPTGISAAYAGEGSARFEPQVLAAGSINSFAWAAQVGVPLGGRKGEMFGDMKAGTVVNGTLAAGFQTADGQLLVGPEVRAAVPANKHVFETQYGSIVAGIGAHYRFIEGWRAHVGGGVGIGDGLGTPLWNASAALEWAPFAATEPAKESEQKQEVTLVVDARPPAVDTDGDGISDDLDACPAVAGVGNDDPAKIGCPEVSPVAEGLPLPDADGDGILDADDACPKEAGPVSTDPTFTGCPAVVITDVKFKVSSDVFLAESLPGLERLAAHLARTPASHRFRVEGHSDTSGDAAENVTLSGKRAAAVVRFLVGKGLAADRFDSLGLGSTVPLVDNDTRENRALNRRVEVHILDGKVE